MKNKQNWIPIIGIASLVLCVVSGIFSTVLNAASGPEMMMSGRPYVEEIATPQPKTVEPDPTDGLTLAQKNAYRKAKSYLSFSAFSEPGLIHQLEYEGFDPADSAVAIALLAPDWNAEALKKANSYLNTSSFSKQGLAHQLEYEKFTPDQISYAVESCDADWFAEAAEKAASYLDLSGFSRDGLIRQLEYEGFTPDEITFALREVGY